MTAGTDAQDHLSPREVGRLEVAIENLADAVGGLRGEIGGLRTELSENYVRKDVLEPRLGAVEADVKEHADWLKWAQRIVLALVITALVVFALNGGTVIPAK